MAKAKSARASRGPGKAATAAPRDTPGGKVRVNRAPVLTLWAAVVATRLGYSSPEALSLGKAVAVLNAQAKGRRLGVFAKEPRQAPAGKPAARPAAGKEKQVDLLGRPVPVVRTRAGLRAVVKNDTITPASAQGYVQRAFGASLPAVRSAMEALADALDPRELAGSAYSLYEHFRPVVPPGVTGWGAKGELDLGLIASIARSLRQRDQA